MNASIQEEFEVNKGNDMASPSYSLRWNNHQSHLLTAFDALLQNETLVDVTLVCEESNIKAHKVVLSACSPYFQRIFSETPCKHPVIVLKDLRGWEMQAIVDFMYRGEISVGQEQLPTLIKAAESLQVRGLAHTEPVPVIDKDRPDKDQCYSPASSLPPAPGTQYPDPISSSRLPQIPHLPHISFSSPNYNRQCSSPTPRRKQARPRRRSGDVYGIQDLTKLPSSPSQEDLAENLSVKKHSHNQYENSTASPVNVESEESEPAAEPVNQTQSLEISKSQHPEQTRMDFHNATEHLNIHPPHHFQTLLQESSMENSFPHLASLSQLSLTPPHRLFPGIENCRNPLLNDLHDARLDNHHIPTKKKMGRPKGQHSAPRGGPPRSWTNAELTEALQHVWNKKMTTSQASRIFGIPYNSLLMYVRGKYGKSLKLEQLKKECFGEMNGPLDLLGLNNNNQPPSHKSHKLPEPDLMLGPPGFNPNPYSGHNFYPDFGASFPVPVGMVHLLPQSDKNREPVNMAVDYAKEDRNSSTPLDYAKDSNKNSPAALDYIKQEHNNTNNCIDNDDSPNIPREIPVGQQQNGQD